MALPVAIVAVLSLLLQVAAAPCLFFAPANGPLAPGSICHAATGDAGGNAPQPSHGCQCSCPLCQVTTAASLPTPAAPRLPAPSVAPVRAIAVANTAAPGAAWAAYASRAPPAIG